MPKKENDFTCYYSMWECLPESVLASIFAHLNLIDKMSASAVCSSWNEASCHPAAWTRLHIGPQSFSNAHFQQEACLDKLKEMIRYCYDLTLDITVFPKSPVPQVMEIACNNCRKLKKITVLDSSPHPTLNISQMQLDSLNNLLNRNKILSYLDLEEVKLSPGPNKHPLPFGEFPIY